MMTMTPQDVIRKIIGNNTNPMINELMTMAQNGNYQSVENFARNMLKSQGRDFDKEFSDFKKNIMK